MPEKLSPALLGIVRLMSNIFEGDQESFRKLLQFDCHLQIILGPFGDDFVTAAESFVASLD